MKTIYLLILLVLSIKNGELLAQAFQWEKQIGGTGDDVGNAITTDASGNVYVTGNFQGKADFDPGTDSLNLTAIGGQDIFVSKLNSAGNLIWAKQMGGPNIDYGNDITVDASGNSYTIGFFLETADFDPGVNVFNLTSAGSYDVFISKLDASGNFVWAKQIGGTGTDVGTSIAVDAGGNIYVTGTFQDIATFDTSSTHSLTSVGGDDIFVAKIDAAGNMAWINQIGGISSDYASSIAVDLSGNVYTTGNFNDVVDFDPGSGSFSLTSVGTIDVFISKLNNAGGFVWAKQMGGTGMDYANSIAIDGSNNVYTTGIFNNTADFNMSSGGFTLTTAGNDDLFITKSDVAGNLIWAKQMGGVDFDAGNAVTIDGSGYVYTTGYFGGTANFNSASGTTTLTSAGSSDAFISKLSPAGNLVWVNQTGGTDTDRGNAIVIDAFDNLYAIGNFADTASYCTDKDTFNIISDGAHDVYIHKMGDVVTAVTETNKGHLHLYPNPTSGTVIFEMPDKQTEIVLSVYDQLWNEIMLNTYTNTFSGQFTINAAPGIYFITIKTGTEQSVLKLVKL